MIARVCDRLATLALQAGPHQPALRDARRTITYAELAPTVAALAIWLRAQEYQVVALQIENSVEWALLDLACDDADIVCLPLPDFFSSSQIQHCLDAARADVLIDTQAGADGLALPLPVPLYAHRLRPNLTMPAWPAGTRKITFTSGSTGQPKGVCLDAALPWRVAQSLTQTIGLHGGRHLCLLPLPALLENIAGIYAPLLSGGEVVLPDAATRGLSGSSGLNLPALLACIEREQPHSMILLPQLLTALTAACRQGWHAPPSLQFVAVGGARVAPQLLVEARATGLPVYEGYGLSECGSVVALNTPAHDRPGYVGRVLPHCDVTLDHGEIVVRGAAHLGYLGEPDSWRPRRIATGDLGALDHDSDSDEFLRVDGRRKNLLITTFGRNVNPEWIESELMAAPLLTHCIVLGEARPHLAALLSAPDGIADNTIQDWLDSVNARLPDYARIRTWHRLDRAAWKPLLTANGRPRRDLIERHCSAAIATLYAVDECATTPLSPQRKIDA